MPAIVTIPIDAPGTYLTPLEVNLRPASTATTFGPRPPALGGATAVARRLSLPSALRRWDGTTWVTEYVPRF